MAGDREASAGLRHRPAHGLFGAAVDASVWFADFEVRAFDDASFAQAGIDCPLSVRAAVPKRRAEFFHGRRCASAALQAAGAVPAQVAIGAMRAPVWPAGVIGSITHTSRAAAALVLPAALHRGVGIDLEDRTQADAETLAALERGVFNARERALLTQHDGALGLLLGFSVKESFYKAVAGVVGRFLDFDTIEVDAPDFAAGRIGFTVRQPCHAQWPAGARGTAGFELLDDGHLLTGVLW